MNPPPDDPHHPPPPVPAAPLEYRGAPGRMDRPQTRVPYLIQVVIGFFAWVAGLSMTALAFQQQMGETGIYAVVIVALIAIAGSAIYLQSFWGWRGYVLGISLAMGLSCLVPVVTILILCGPGSRG